MVVEDYKEEISDAQKDKYYNDRNDKEGSYKNDEKRKTNVGYSFKLEIGISILFFFFQVQEKLPKEMTQGPLDFVHIDSKQRIARIRGFKPMSAYNLQVLSCHLFTPLPPITVYCYVPVCMSVGNCCITT